VDGVWEAPQVVEHKERGLFSSILNRLLQRKPAGSEVEQEAA
jgi:predicted CopG family antitoxin